VVELTAALTQELAEVSAAFSAASFHQADLEAELKVEPTAALAEALTLEAFSVVVLVAAVVPAEV
jgi:hypothetical protein